MSIFSRILNSSIKFYFLTYNGIKNEPKGGFFMQTLKKMIVTFFIILFLSTHVSFCLESYVWDDSTLPTSGEETSGNFLNIESGSAILIEQNSGKVLYEYNSHEPLRPASVTKVMSILLIMEALDSGKISLSDAVPCSENARNMGGSQIWLNESEKLSVDEMLKAICVVSANDCVMAMAEFIAGSEEIFVQQMNDKAKELGMNDTHFINCHGIDEDGHVTSSHDIALMSRELLTKHPTITNYTTIWMDSLRDGQSELTNTNKLVRTYEGCTGLKTGSTSLALYNLSASATRNDLSLIAVVMKGPTSEKRFSEAKKLLDYGFANFSYTKTSTAGAFLQTAEVQKGTKKEVNLVYESDSGALIKNSENGNVSSEVTLNENITAPITTGDVLGHVNFHLNDEQIATVNLVAENDVDKITVVNLFGMITELWVNLFR